MHVGAQAEVRGGQQLPCQLKTGRPVSRCSCFTVAVCLLLAFTEVLRGT